LSQVLSLGARHHDALVVQARTLAETDKAPPRPAHDYKPGSPQAVTLETHYVARRAELEQAEV
jgi:hypothetical protein